MCGDVAAKKFMQKIINEGPYLPDQMSNADGTVLYLIECQLIYFYRVNLWLNIKSKNGNTLTSQKCKQTGACSHASLGKPMGIEKHYQGNTSCTVLIKYFR
jgi:hypothetical protein